MNAVLVWVKNNKLASLLLLIMAVYAAAQNRVVNPLKYGAASVAPGVMREATMTTGLVADNSEPFFPPPYPESDVPPSDAANRLVITDTNLSLLVNDVTATIKSVQQEAESLGGFLVNSDVNIPEGASSGSITVRVPSDRLDQALESFRKLSVRVVSENVTGRDVTDQFEDIQARIDVLNKTRAKFEAILDQASEIQDLLQVQRELVSLQAQIDNLKGRQEYLEQSARLSKITVYLSTDELALPYTPDEVWRPKVIFKTAVRSLITSSRSAANALIWLAVYSIVWTPALFLVWTFRRYARRRSQTPSS